MLAVAAAAMITVSIVDLFYHIAAEIGLNHTIVACLCGIFTVVMAKKIGSIVVPSTKADNVSKKILVLVPPTSVTNASPSLFVTFFVPVS